MRRSKVERLALRGDVDGLVAAAGSDKSRMSAVEALVHIGDQQAVAGLVSLLSHDDVRVRAEAAQALARLEGHDVQEPLIRALDDPSGLVSVWGAHGLARLGGERSVDALRKHGEFEAIWEALGKDDVITQRASLRALRAHGSVPVHIEDRVELLVGLMEGADPDLARSAEDMFAVLAPRMVEASTEQMWRLLHHRSGTVRQSVLRAALQLSERGRAAEVVVSHLRNHSQDERVADLLVSSRDSVVDLLQTVATDESHLRSVREKAVALLRRIGTPAAKAAIGAYLTSLESQRQMSLWRAEQKSQALEAWNLLLSSSQVDPREAAMALAVIYDKFPRGAHYQDPAATPVLQLGEHLNEVGGFSLMLQVFDHFAATRPDLKRNLEILWDGIGEWHG